MTGHAADGPGLPAASSPQPRVVPAGAGDLEALGQVIADAFHALPQSRWLIPDPAARRAVLPGYFRLQAEHAITHGAAFTTPGRDAVALWLHASEDAPAQPAGYRERLAAVTGPWTDRFLAFDEALDRNHPAGVPHHHLAILAVRPGQQGQGTGSLLLAACHQALDRDGTPAFLQAASQHSCRLYQRHGYILLPAAPFCLPGGSAPMWPMWREPQPCDGPA